MRRIVLLAVVLLALLFQGLAFAGGQVRWQKDGVVIAWGTFDGGGWQPLAIVPDSRGGAIISWADTRGSHESIYAQRVDSSGACLWDSGGVCLRSDTWFPDQMNAVSDGRGGAIVVWEDSPGVYAPWIRAQRVDSSGVVRWGPPSNPLIVAYPITDDVAFWPSIVSDGQGGAIIAWATVIFHNMEWIANRLYAQRVDSSGAAMWEYNGVLIDSPNVEAYFPEAASDGQGGIIISWADRWGTGDNNYACHLNGEGRILWNNILCEAEGWQGPGLIVSDGEGGVSSPGMIEEEISTRISMHSGLAVEVILYGRSMGFQSVWKIVCRM